MARPKTIISRAELAGILGLSRARITQLSKRKDFPLRPDGMVDRVKATAWYRENVHESGANKRGPKPAALQVPAAVPAATVDVTAPDAGGVETFSAAQRRKESALADVREMEAAKMRGALIDASDVKRVWAGHVMVVRNRLLALPGKLAPAVAANSDAAQCQELIRVEIYEALTELSHSGADTAPAA
jgi:phage terminase Nu1 subunit (DNA packaging protein)